MTDTVVHGSDLPQVGVLGAPDAHSQLYQKEDAKSYFIETFTGKRFYFDNVHDNDISIVDIAHALAHNCRFTGHTRLFYSVAEHCLHASNNVAPEHQLAALLHDASEAYLHDVPSPLKWWLAEHGFHAFRELDTQIEKAIFKRFDVNYEVSAEAVKVADRRMLATEMRDLMPTKAWPGGADPYDNIDLRHHTLSPVLACDLFIERFYELWTPTAQLAPLHKSIDVV